MSRLPIQSIESTAGTTSEMLSSLKTALGMVPNMAGAMANSPAVLSSWIHFNSALADASLPASIREQIALLTAERNGCAYCLSAHSALGRMSGLAPDQIDAARDASAEDPRAQASLAFASRVLETQGGIEPSDIDRVRAAGFEDAQIAEIVAAVALNYFTNIFNRAFDTEIDFPLVTPRTCATC